MKISFNWLKKYISLDQTPESIAEILTHSGLEVEGVEMQESIPGGLKKYVVGHVLTCEKHPNADKLSKTTVDVGNGLTLPIVCGAPNVAAGQKVVVALPGAEVRLEGKEPFTIQKTKIRSEVSEGMICAEDELGLGHSHDGILVLDPATEVGTPAAVLFNIQTDYILEIGLTPNRADAASHYGVARELKALLKKDLLQNISDLNFKPEIASPIRVEVKNTEACPRYAGVYIQGVKVSDSPEWLKLALKSIGLSPINNIVDITNYVLHGLGQPLHAFDADKIASGKVIVRTALNEPFITLDGKERKLTEADLVIADVQHPMGIAGVFGGKESAISSETINIFLESAYFNPDYIRKTAQRLGLKTDASFRFERGTNPEMVLPGLKQAVMLIQEIAGGKASEMTDLYPAKIQPFKVTLKWSRLFSLIGEKIPVETVKHILSSLEIEIVSDDNEILELSVPPYRVDVQREADIVEEVLRIYGYNNIRIKPYLSSKFLASFPPKDSDKTKLNLGKLLVAKGFFEIYTNSLTSVSKLTEESKGVKILNALSSELEVMRQLLIPSGLDVVNHNVNRRQKDLKLFEFGYVYHLQEGKPKYKEELHLSLILSGNRQAETWQTKSGNVEFHDLKNVLSEVLVQLGVKDFQLQACDSRVFNQSVEIISQKKSLGIFGSVSKDTLKAADLKQDVFAAELNLDQIFALKSKGLVYKEIAKFPEVRRDLSLVIDKNIKFEEIEKIAKKAEPILIKAVNSFDTFEGEALGKAKKAYSISYFLQDDTKTLTDNEIDAVMSKLITTYEAELGAVIRR